jgi:hypothetical protein
VLCDRLPLDKKKLIQNWEDLERLMKKTLILFTKEFLTIPNRGKQDLKKI